MTVKLHKNKHFLCVLYMLLYVCFRVNIHTTKRQEVITMTRTQLTENFILGDYNTSISREDFERCFHKTKEKIRFTFGGWDGKVTTAKAESARFTELTSEVAKTTSTSRLESTSTRFSKTTWLKRKPPANFTPQQCGQSM